MITHLYMLFSVIILTLLGNWSQIATSLQVKRAVGKWPVGFILGEVNHFLFGVAVGVALCLWVGL